MKKVLFLTMGVMLSLFLAGCGSDSVDEDLEAEAKTQELRDEYNAKLQGEWHREVIDEKNRFFERYSFKADHTYTVERVWQVRANANADWEEIEDPTIVGPIEDMWVLKWVRTSPTSGINTLQLLGKVGAMTLQFNGIVNDKLTMGALYLAEDDIATYERGHGQPSFEN